MSEWNKQGVECPTCGERVSGGGLAILEHGRKHATTAPALHEKRRIIAMDACSECTSPPGEVGPYCGTCISGVRNARAAMLDEAECMVRRAAAIAAETGAPLLAQRLIQDAEYLAVRRREAEAREGQQMPAYAVMSQNVGNPCWQCDAPLGTTEDCMTCAAKRREAKP